MRNEVIATVKQFADNVCKLHDERIGATHYNDKLTDGRRSVKLTGLLQQNVAQAVAQAITAHFGYEARIVKCVRWGSNSNWYNVRFYY